jgi:hypothetical protein
MRNTSLEAASEIMTENIERNAHSLSHAKVLTPVQAHRAHCLRCTAGSTKRVRECPQKDCPSYPFRMGKNPNRRGVHPRGIIPPGLAKTHVLRRGQI